MSSQERTKPYLKLPKSITPSMAAMSQEGVYLLDCATVFFLYVCRGAPSSALSSLFGLAALPAEGGGGESVRGADFLHISTLSQSKRASCKRLLAAAGQLPSALDPASDLSSRLLAVVSDLRSDRPGHSPLKVVFQGRSETAEDETELLSRLVDDSTPHEVSYVDFLVAVHRKIQAKMT